MLSQGMPCPLHLLLLVIHLGSSGNSNNKPNTAVLCYSAQSCFASAAAAAAATAAACRLLGWAS
jgi:hypothetical protein